MKQQQIVPMRMATQKQQNISNFTYFRSQTNLAVPLGLIIVIALLIYCHLETFFYINLSESKGLLGVMFLIENKKKNKYNCSGPQHLKFKRVRYQFNQKLLHHC